MKTSNSKIVIEIYLYYLVYAALAFAVNGSTASVYSPAVMIALHIFNGRSITISVAIAAAYSAIFFVDIGRNWVVFGHGAWFEFFCTTNNDFDRGSSIYALSLLYIPSVTILAYIDVYSMPKDLSKTFLWRSSIFRKLFTAVFVILIWREILLRRYRVIISALDMRGIEIPRHGAPILLSHLWIPMMIRSIILESIEMAEIHRLLNIDHVNFDNIIGDL